MKKNKKIFENKTKKTYNIVFAIIFLIGIFFIARNVFLENNGFNQVTGNYLTNTSINLSLTITNAKPTPPIIIFPNNVYTFNKVRFAWEESYDINGDPITYNIQISETGTFSSLLINVNLNRLTYEMPFNLDYKIYYFRVRAHDGFEYGQFSKVTTFGIKPPDVIPNATNTTEKIDEEYIQEGVQIVQIDSDGDGVYDALDLCENTTTGNVTDIFGCDCNQKVCEDRNICTDDYCNFEDASCRFFFNNTRKCGLFVDCPSDKCINGNYYNFSDEKGTCLNGMCFENSCIPQIIYKSELCTQPERINITQKEIIVEEEKYTYNKQLESFDDDNDKIPNYRDECPDSIVKYVDRYGCNCEQKRCIDLDENTIDLCYRGKCIFAIKDSEEYNLTTKLLEKEKETTKFNFTLLYFSIALLGVFISVFLIPSIKKEKKGKPKVQKEIEDDDDDDESEFSLDNISNVK